VLTLDEEDYEVLGFGEQYGKSWRDSPEGRRLRKDARKRFMQTDKGKEMRARVWAKYYEKHRLKLIEQNRQRRKAERDADSRTDQKDQE
jgi:hypothetical protein